MQGGASLSAIISNVVRDDIKHTGGYKQIIH